MQLNLSSMENKAQWQAVHTQLPAYDVRAMAEETRRHPMWVHFGAGNIFRGFIAALQQRLLNAGESTRGITAAETFDQEIFEKIYAPHDNLTLSVTLNPDGTTSREIIASVAETVSGDATNAAAWARMKEIFRDPGLQMVSYTITEKGYALRRPDGTLLPAAQQDMENGPACPRHAMSVTAALSGRRLSHCGVLHGQLQPQRRKAWRGCGGDCQGMGGQRQGSCGVPCLCAG